MHTREITMKRSITGLALSASILLLFLLTSTGVSAKTTTIKFSTWHPAVSKEVQTVWQPLMEKIKTESNGQLDYTMYAGGALGKGPAHYELVKKGISDMGYFTLTWTPGKFPLSEILSMAMWVDGKDLAADIGNELYEKSLKEEFKGIHVLELNGCIQSFLWTRKPVTQLADLKGLKIRTPGGMQTRYIKNLGAEPVFMPLSDVYTSLDSGAIDGVVTCPPLVEAFKLYEVLHHGVIATFGCVTEGVVYNQRKWKKLPPDMQELITRLAHNPYRTTGGLNKASYGEMMTDLQEKGMILHELDPATQKEWFKSYQQVTRDWVQEQKNPAKAKDVVLQLTEILQKHDVTPVATPEEWLGETANPSD
jgi:TRAP-type C4-dicarboxylate transport system substrate-binding protein